MAGTVLSSREALSDGTPQEARRRRKRTMSAAARRRVLTSLRALYGPLCWY